MTALALYLMVSMFVIVAALLEFAVVLVMKHYPITNDVPQMLVKSKSVKNKQDMKDAEDMGARVYAANVIKHAWVSKKLFLRRLNYQKIDRFCFILFPFLFIVFNVTYFSYYKIA